MNGTAERARAEMMERVRKAMGFSWIGTREQLDTMLDVIVEACAERAFATMAAIRFPIEKVRVVTSTIRELKA